eukprot:7671990-Lingulodinium_polyedra.AAC.1
MSAGNCGVCFAPLSSMGQGGNQPKIWATSSSHSRNHCNFSSCHPNSASRNLARSALYSAGLARRSLRAPG